MGLCTTAAELQRHDRYDMSLFACLNYPDAAGADLDLISDWVCWWSVWNDLTDRPEFLHDPDRVTRFFSSLAAVVELSEREIDEEMPAQDNRFVVAFSDIWRRWRRGMSAEFVSRTGRNWVNWFNSYIVECHNRHAGASLDVDTYHQIRDFTGAVILELDAAERVGHYEVPPELLEIPPVRAMREITVRVINITQDVQSLPKEEEAGDQHNLVLVLERRHSLTRMQALREVHVMIRRWTDGFLAEEASVPRFLDQFEVPLARRRPVYKHIDNMRTLMKGGVEFCAASGRYVKL